MLRRVSIPLIPGSSCEGAITERSVLTYVCTPSAFDRDPENVILQAGGEDAVLSFFKENNLSACLESLMAHISIEQRPMGYRSCQFKTVSPIFKLEATYA